MSLGNRSSITTGEKTVAVADGAHAVQLPDVEVPEGYEATVTAKHLNDGRIYLGGTKAEAEAHTISLGPDDVFTEYPTNLNAIWIDADNDGEGIDYEVPQ